MLRNIIQGTLTATLLALTACSGQVEDSSMYLTVTEEHALVTADGTVVCESPK